MHLFSAAICEQQGFASHTQPEGSCVPEAGEISYLTDTLSRKVLREAANTPATCDKGES